MRYLSALFLLLSCIPMSFTFAELPTSDSRFLGGETRCGTVSPRHPFMGMIETLTPQTQSKNAQEGGLTIIPVAVHVIHGTNQVGNVSDSRIASQIQVLDDAFVGTGFSFVLSHISRTERQDWFDDCANKQTERAIRQALAIDPAHTLNFYTCNPADFLGRATFPWDFPEDSHRHGVVLSHDTLPGSGAIPYNLGDTAVHEVGHYLGLYHTFENGCSALSDFVADTPTEDSPAFGCPVGRNTCVKGGGADPIHNYMDYTDDDCMDEFTAGQIARMQIMVSGWRPNL